MALSARTAALRALITWRTSGGWSDTVLHAAIVSAQLDTRDAGLCTALFYGVVQNQALLDYYLDSLLTGRKHLRPVLRDILRLAAFQIIFLDRVPDSAAVNEAVRQAKQYFDQREVSLTNAVLRNLSRQKDKLELPKDYAVRYSHPGELVDLIKESAGKHLGAILEADNTSPEISVQWNPLRCSEPELLESLQTSGVSAEPHPWLSGCYLLQGTGNPENLPGFQRGFFQIQDAAARLSVRCLALQPGMRVLDLCAAPGGKSAAAAVYMENRGSILSCDVHGGKLPEIESAAKRLGADIIRTEENDGTIFRPEWAEQFDAVIADVPCSGLGVIRKKPDIRYKDLSAMAELPTLQAALLENAGRYVRPGGQLMYSTCTILRRENEDVAEHFLKAHPEFRAEALPLPKPLESRQPGMLTLYQGIDCCDGFFLCRMRKNP